MSKRDDRGFWRGHLRHILMTLLAMLPILYVLSIGPAYRALEMHDWPAAWSRIYRTSYTPLAWATNYSPLMERLIYEYIRMWEPSIETKG